jgi:hypothetical protein
MMLKSRAAMFVLLVLLPIVVSAQKTGDTAALKAELEQIHAEWYAAFDKGDGAPMDRIEVQNFVFVNPDGKGKSFGSPRHAPGT